MVSLTSLAIATFFVVTVYHFFYKENKKGNLPGPRGLPYFGSAFSLTKPMHTCLSSMAGIYGKVFSLKIFGNDIVVISDAKLGREAFNNPALIGRPHTKLFEAFSNGRQGIVSTEGQEWSDQRRFALRHLRDFGFGKNAMEELIMDEVKEIIDWIKSVEGKPNELDRKFNLAVLNSLWKITTGSRLKQDDEKLHNLLLSCQKGLSQVSKTPIGLFFPKLAMAFPNVSGWSKLTDGINGILTFIRGAIEEHKSTFSPDFQRDFLDDYLKEMKNTTDPNSSFYGERGNTSLESVMLDLFNAGSETTSATLTYTILFLASNPEAYKKIQNEIDQVVGNSRLPSLTDRENLPYTEAVIYETLRKSSLVALGVFHFSTESTKIADYDIPQGSWICLNQYHIHNDPKVWGDPKNFRPERFIGPDGKVKKHESLVPFSVGKRMCIGESLARDETFLFLTSIIQRFDIKLDPKAGNPSLESPHETFLRPPQVKVVFKDRNTA